MLGVGCWVLFNVLTNLTLCYRTMIQLVMQHGYGSSTELSQKIVSHYVAKVRTQVYKILLSIDMLGNPVGLLGDVGSGVVSFFYEPAMGLMKSPTDFAAGVGKGTKQLLTSSISGVANFGTWWWGWGCWTWVGVLDMLVWTCWCGQWTWWCDGSYSCLCC